VFAGEGEGKDKADKNKQDRRHTLYWAPPKIHRKNLSMCWPDHSRYLSLLSSDIFWQG
jgi:hypothetical protein